MNEIIKWREPASRLYSPRPLGRSDIDGVETILQQWAFNHGHSKELREVFAHIGETLRSSSDRSYFVMKYMDTVVGVAGIKPPGREMRKFNATPGNAQEIIDLFVYEKFQRKGVGRRLAAKIERESNKTGAKYLLAKVAPMYRDTASGFFKQYFTHAGVIPHRFKETSYEHVWRKELRGVMTLILP